MGLVEEGFTCSGGTPLSADQCVDSKQPEFKLSYISSENQLYIEFPDEEVFLQSFSIDENNVSIEVTGPMEPYNFEWEIGKEFVTSDAL